MDWFLITPFSINVLNVLILILFMVYFLFRAKRKSKATLFLIAFFMGVALVFLSFAFIFSSLNPFYSTLAWLILHAVIFTSIAMVQFAYYFPQNLHPLESRLVLVLSIIAALLAYPYYIYRALSIHPVYTFEGHMYAFFGTPEIGIVIGSEILWMLVVFFRKAAALSSYQYSGFLKQWSEPPEKIPLKKSLLQFLSRFCISWIKVYKARNRSAKAIRNLGLIFISPIVTISAVIMAYQGIISWDVFAHILGTGLMVVAFLFIILYVNNSSEPSTFMIKLVGISLGTILIVLGLGANIAISIKDEAYDKKRIAEINQCKSAVSNNDFSELPEDVLYILSRPLDKRPSSGDYDKIFARDPDFRLPQVGERDIKRLWRVKGEIGSQTAPEMRRQYGKADALEAKYFYVHYNFSSKGKLYEVGYSYIGYRKQIHETGLMLVFAIIGSTFIVIVVFPFFFRGSLVKPLNLLLEGVKQVNRGNLEVVVPVEVEDEIGFLSGSFNNMVRSILDTENRLKDTLGHQVKLTEAYSCFVPRELLKFLEKESILDIRLGDHVQKEMTILFSDIRSFTVLSEKMTPRENFDFINSYLNRVGPVVRDNNGFIDKYIGDAVMALFPDKAEDALRTAIEMQSEVEDFNLNREKMGLDPIDIGIGVHTGELMLGMIGEEKRMDGTVISDTVNLAFRVEGLTKLYGAKIIMSKKTLDRLESPLDFKFRFLDRVQVKGKREWIDIFEIFDSLSPESLSLKLQTKEDFEQGISLYHKGEFPEALQYFKKVSKADSHDKAARLFMERCERTKIKSPSPSP